jgi:hypothetical protein
MAKAEAKSEIKPASHEPIPPVGQRSHRATYARDKRNGGYIIRVEGPQASKFAGRQVPVVRKDGTEDMETLTDLIWSGINDESGKPASLYKFEAKPRDKDTDEVPF